MDRKKQLEAYKRGAPKAKEFLTRPDGRIEWVCKHGVGHAVDAPENYKVLLGRWWDSHGCDGCCSK